MREKKSVLVQPPLFKHHYNVPPTHILILVLPHLKVQISQKTILSYPLLFGNSVFHNPSTNHRTCDCWKVLKYCYSSPFWCCVEWEFMKIEISIFESLQLYWIRIYEYWIWMHGSSSGFECTAGWKICAVTFCSQIYATVNHPMNWLQSPFTMEEY